MDTGNKSLDELDHQCVEERPFATMLDLTIETLSLEIFGAAGQEHRIEPIVRRAMDIAVEVLPDTETSAQIERLTLAPIGLRLAAMSDEQAATRIAEEILDALTLRLKG